MNNFKALSYYPENDGTYVLVYGHELIMEREVKESEFQEDEGWKQYEKMPAEFYIVTQNSKIRVQRETIETT